jgi:hypothetical protein
MVRGFFRPVPYLAFPLYRNSASGNGTETRDTIYTEDNKTKYSIVYYDYNPDGPVKYSGSYTLIDDRMSRERTNSK